ncbi:hypothetical protein, partial [Campylobacter jejuni]|uniref:hypothetical protein n=1 Tax=Campylobacter jejuni TaxID=197 RepID=UPI001E60A40F
GATTQISNDSYLDALTLTDVIFKRVKADVKILAPPSFTTSLGALKGTFVQAIDRLSKTGGSVRILTTGSDMPNWLDQLCRQYDG